MERKDRFLTLLRSSFNDDWQADGRSRADVSNPASGGGNGSLPRHHAHACMQNHFLRFDKRGTLVRADLEHHTDKDVMFHHS
mmetsp:Transcript_52781/g.123454  ORF Transcript_52781/g.123454 Transcript_52781/m.123454 type:complete len:82 (-) Transcript_52781:14-259(-)